MTKRDGRTVWIKPLACEPPYPIIGAERRRLDALREALSHLWAMPAFDELACGRVRQEMKAILRRHRPAPLAGLDVQTEIAGIIKRRRKRGSFLGQKTTPVSRDRDV